MNPATYGRSEEHTSELQSLRHLVCRLLLEKKKNQLPQEKLSTQPSCRVVKKLLPYLATLTMPGLTSRCRQKHLPESLVFFFKEPAFPDIYTLSLHAALPI